jgi:hypothetical protein
MGTVKWLLGTHFQWLITTDKFHVHLSQTGFTAHLVKENNVHIRNITPDATPYPLGLPINLVPESDEDEQCPTFKECKKNTKL